jgi:hypothetical protein
MPETIVDGWGHYRLNCGAQAYLDPTCWPECRHTSKPEAHELDA